MKCKFENAKFQFLGVVAYIKIIAVAFIFNPYGVNNSLRFQCVTNIDSLWESEK